jgi:hypothetical protein
LKLALSQQQKSWILSELNLDNRTKITQAAIHLLKQGQAADIPASGLSMFPILLPGDTLRVQPLQPESLTKGAIVVFQESDRLIAHRFIRLKKNTLYTKGDGLKKFDPPLKKELLLGVVSHRIRGQHVSSFSSSLQKNTAKLTSWLTPISGFLSFYLARAWYKWFYLKKVN